MNADPLDRLHTAKPAEDQEAPRWPQVPAVEGHFYGFLDRSHGQAMVAMTQETFKQVDETIQVMQAKVIQLQFENKQLRQHAVANPDGDKKNGLIIPGH